METSMHADKAPSPMPNLCRLVEILLRKARRRKQGAKPTSTEQGSTIPEHDFQELCQSTTEEEIPCPTFKGRTPDQVSLAELTAEFRALTVAQEHQSRQHLGLETCPPADSIPWRWVRQGDAELTALAPSEMCRAGFPEQAFAQQNTVACSSELDSKNRAIKKGSDQTDVLIESAKSVQVSSEGTRPTKDQDRVAKLTGRSLLKAEAPAPVSPAVQVTQLRWVRMANNQLVLAQVPVIGQGPPGIVQPVQPHMGSATPPAAAGPPAQPRVTPEKPSWTTLAAVSPEEHKQRWLRMANNQLVLAQVPVIGQGSPGIVQPVQPHMGSATPPPAAPSLAQPRVTPEKPSWTTLAAVSPEEHKQRWLRMANNQQLLAQVPVIGQGLPGIVQPVQPHMGSPTPPAAAGPPAQPRVTPEKPSWTTLAAVSPEEHKQMIGERLHTQIHQIYPGLTKKITGMLLEMDNKDLLRLLESPEMLKSSADDAAKVLQQHVMMKPRLTTDLLEPFPTAQQKQMLGERLFPKIQRLQPSLAGKITGMLLNLDNPQVLELLEDGQLLKTRTEEAVVVLIQAHLEEHLSAQASGKRSLAGALTGEDSSSGDVSERQSLTGGLLLSEEKFGKESVMLGGCVGKERVVNASVSLENPPPKNQETSSLVLGISGQRSSCENVRNEESSEKGELGAPSTAEDISVPLSVTGSNLQREMLSDISGTKLLATDTPAIQTLTDNVEESYPPSSNVLDFSEIVSERRPLKDETIKSRSLVDEICDTSLARGRFTEAVWAALSPIEDDPERLSLIADQKMQSLTGHVTAPQQRNSMPEEQPLSDTVPGKPLLTGNVSEKQLTDDVLAGDLISRTRIPGRQSMSENFPETLSQTQGNFRGPPANKARDVSENQTVCGSAPVSQTWVNVERQSQSDDNQSPALSSDLQELQKEALREQLQPVVEGLYPGLGREVCQILLTGADPGELSAIMMRHPDILRAKVAEAASALQTRTAQQAAHQQMLLQSMMIQQQQTQILGQRLYAMIQPAYPDLAAQLTGVLLERGVWEVAEMVQRPQVLASRLGEALALVQVHRRPPFTAQALELFPPTMHKQILADRLLPLVQTYRPDGAREITSMLLSLENWKLIDMLNNPEMLHGTVDNAVRYLPQITHAGGLQIAETAKNEDLSVQCMEGKDTGSACGEADQTNKDNDYPPHETSPNQDIGTVKAADLARTDSKAEAEHTHSGIMAEPRKTPNSTADLPCADSDAKRGHSERMSEPGKCTNSSEDSLLKRAGEILKSEGNVIEEKGEHYQLSDDDSKSQAEDNRRAKAGDSPASPEAVKQSAKHEDLQASASTSQDAQENVALRTQGNVPQCGVVDQQGLPLDVFEVVAQRQQQKQILGEYIFAQVQRLQPELAAKITGMLLGMDNSELIRLLNDPDLLKDQVDEALAVLRAYQREMEERRKEDSASSEPQVTVTIPSPQMDKNSDSDCEETVEAVSNCEEE